MRRGLCGRLAESRRRRARSNIRLMPSMRPASSGSQPGRRAPRIQTLARSLADRGGRQRVAKADAARPGSVQVAGAHQRTETR